MAYVEAYLIESTQPAQIMVDSGNLVGNLVSKAFADSLGLKYRPSCHVINTVSKEVQLKAVGVCNPMRMQVLGFNSVFTV